jgi:hypothetical protein
VPARDTPANAPPPRAGHARIMSIRIWIISHIIFSFFFRFLDAPVTPAQNANLSMPACGWRIVKNPFRPRLPIDSPVFRFCFRYQSTA